MRRWLCALMIPVLLLAGCSGGVDEAEQAALDVRACYLAAAGCTAELDITADYGQRVFSCVLAMEHTAGEETVLTVIEPELIAGITARLKDGESTLEYDGVYLETGALSAAGLSPIDCIPYLWQEIREGYIASWGLETLGEQACVRFSTADPNAAPGEGQETTLWFAREDFALCRGEISVDGRMVLACDMTNFIWKEKEE